VSVPTSESYVTAAGRRHRRIPLLGMRIAPSRRLAASLVAMHAMAAWVVLHGTWPAVYGFAGAMVLLAHATWSVRRHALLRASASIIALHVSGEDECALQALSGERILGQIDGSSFVVTWMIVLRVAVRGRRRLHSVVLLPDAVRAEDFRRLRTRLRWSRVEQPRGVDANAWL